VKKETIVLGSVAAICVTLLVAALIVRSGGQAGGPAQAGVAPATAEGATPAEGSVGAEGGATPPSGGTPAPAAPAPTASPEASPEEPSFTSEQNRREVTLFFQEATSEYLGPEKRKIFLTTSITDQAKQIVVELITGPLEKQLLPTLPPQTRLRGLYLDRAGTAFVDLSSEVADFHPGGTNEEIATIFSLVDSLVYNLPEIKRVHILVNGEERDSLKNHLDLRRDYSKDMSIVDMDRKAAQ
jgi:sporulation and spore germination protein